MKPGRGEVSTLAAGGPARHVPVLLDAVMAAVEPQPGGLYLDATFGAGGYTKAILATPGTRVLAVDRDPSAIAAGRDLAASMKDRLELRLGRFGALESIAAAAGMQDFDGIMLDVGVSSMQLDTAERGFSFRLDGPLDMRMEGNGRTAADIVNSESEQRLADILYYFGEERASRRIARAIVYDRTTEPFTTTLQLAEMIARVAPLKPTDIHPATRTFQALRIAVNDELGELVAALAAAERLLGPGGRLAIVSFHSLEDRLAKLFFAQRSRRGQTQSRLLPGEPVPSPATFRVFGRQPIVADAAEMEANPRSRSAKLRVGERTEAPARDLDQDILALAALPAAQRERRGR